MVLVFDGPIVMNTVHLESLLKLQICGSKKTLERESS